MFERSDLGPGEAAELRREIVDLATAVAVLTRKGIDTRRASAVKVVEELATAALFEITTVYDLPYVGSHRLENRRQDEAD